MHRHLTFIDLFNKDSRAVTDKDREKIFIEIKRLHASGIQHFIVTHGTLTMVQTAAYLNKKCVAAKLDDVHVVICGSMIPNAGFAPSDAQFNIGFALAKLSMLHGSEQAGAWIYVNGLLSKPDNISKNVKKARFEITKIKA